MGNNMINWDKLELTKYEPDESYYDEYMMQDFPECRMTIKEWKESVQMGVFNDYDGYAEVFGHDADKAYVSLGVYYPSEFDKVPDNAIDVVWYNR